MKEEHAKQHFIPQCYLKNFSENGKFVNVYSKTNLKKGYPQAISKTAYKDYFYSIPEKYLKKLSNEINSNFIEVKILAEQVETLYSNILDRIIQLANEWIKNSTSTETLKKEERELFAALIAIQYLRMPNIRDKYWNANTKANNERIEIIKSFLNFNKEKHADNFSIQQDEDYAPVFHSQLFLDDFLIKNIQDQIVKKVWIYYVCTDPKIYTSDNPILLKPHKKNEANYYEGFGMPGVEIIFPISSNVLLTIWDEQVFNEKENLNNKFIYLSDKQLREYNCYQYIWANDEVYSLDNNFQLIQLLKSINGGKEVVQPKSVIKVNVNKALQPTKVLLQAGLTQRSISSSNSVQL